MPKELLCKVLYALIIAYGKDKAGKIFKKLLQYIIM